MPVKGFNILGGGLNIKPPIFLERTVLNNDNRNRDRDAVDKNQHDHRTDAIDLSSMEESVDFDELSIENPKATISNIETNDNENESQVTAESSSFINNPNRNEYTAFDKPKALPLKSSYVSRKNLTSNRSAMRNDSSNEKARKVYRGSQRYREDNKRTSHNRSRDEKYQEDGDNHVLNKSTEINANTTPSYFSGTYSTARRLDTTRSTPFYTPTVPTVSKYKTSDSKSNFYGKGAIASTASGASPHRFSIGNGNANEAYQTSKDNRSRNEHSPDLDDHVVIGMRSNYESKNNSFGNQKTHSTRTDSKSKKEISTNPTGPTYLPKNAATGDKIPVSGSSGDRLLSAPRTNIEDTVVRNVNNMLRTMDVIKNKLQDVEIIKLSSTSRTRNGLDIPPSSGPDALVSLAQYFASEDNPKKLNTLERLNSNNNRYIFTNESTDAVIKGDDIKATLLSNNTVNKYSFLFGLNDSQTPIEFEVERVLPNTTEISLSKRNVTHGREVEDTLSILAATPETRQIARVFSNALTSYLENPAAFRQQLIAIRPKEPPLLTKKYNKSTVITSGVQFNNRNWEADNLESLTTTTILPDFGGESYKSSESNIAEEINNNFDSSTDINELLLSTTELFDGTTMSYSQQNQRFSSGNERKHVLELSAELEPPTPDSGEGEEFLQREYSETFVKPHKQQKAKENESDNDLYTTTYLPSIYDNTWPTTPPTTMMAITTTVDSEYLDPLSINDGLMKEKKYRITSNDITTELPLSNNKVEDDETQSVKTSEYIRGRNTRFSLSESTAGQKASSVSDTWQNLFDTYKIPRESLPSNNGLQRIANKLFGGLNENEALHLKNVMAQAEHNRQVLSLLLLLIQTCDDQNGKALERSRKHLLNALIDMDGKLSSESTQGKTSYHKTEELYKNVLTTTEKLPVTTYRRTGAYNFDRRTYTTTAGPPVTTLPLTTETYPATTTFENFVSRRGNTWPPSNQNSVLSNGDSSAIEQTTKFEIHVHDLEEDPHSFVTAALATTLNPLTRTNAVNADAKSDKRALELLQSLYSLASKFNGRR